MKLPTIGNCKDAGGCVLFFSLTVIAWLGYYDFNQELPHIHHIVMKVDQETTTLHHMTANFDAMSKAGKEAFDEQKVFVKKQESSWDQQSTHLSGRIDELLKASAITVANVGNLSESIRKERLPNLESEITKTTQAATGLLDKTTETVGHANSIIDNSHTLETIINFDLISGNMARITNKVDSNLQRSFDDTHQVEDKLAIALDNGGKFIGRANTQFDKLTEHKTFKQKFTSIVVEGFLFNTIKNAPMIAPIIFRR